MWAGGGAKKEGSVASAGPEAPTSPRAASPTASKGERPWRRYQGLVRLVRALELTKARVELEGDLSVSIWLDSVHRVIYAGSNDRDVVSEVVSRFHVHLEAAAHWAKDCFFRNCEEPCELGDNPKREATRSRCCSLMVLRQQERAKGPRASGRSRRCQRTWLVLRSWLANG